MELLLGFVIAALIAMTGVGAGTITAPLLILFLRVPVAQAVGTALAFSAAVKLFIVPVQVMRKQVDWRVLALMLLTGLPGVIVGALLFCRIVSFDAEKSWLYLVLGSTITISSAWHIFRHFHPAAFNEKHAFRPRWLAAVMLPVGLEVGFSSSGAGAMGTMALLSLTRLEPATVVGTDLAFGLCLSLTGGMLHLAAGGLDSPLLIKLILGGLVGGLAGTSFGSRIPARSLRLALAVWLFAIGLQLCWQATILN